MALDDYHAKRHFSKTPEPYGEIVHTETDIPIFVVQKHHASHLHYDFRLEYQGVLLSWAVPKGPSLDPTVKRLAMMVEDHPYDYKDFEGIIPSGYGAGTVMVWDKGSYLSLHSTNKKESDEQISKGLKKGHISFVLYGEKLKGEFSLLRMHNDEKSWLLVKKEDNYASNDSVDTQGLSVITHRTLDEIKNGEQKQLERNDSKADRDFIHPMLANLAEDPFDSTDWIYEVKWDGYRAIADVMDNDVKLYSRNEQPFNKKYPAIVRALEKLPVNAILDGEIVALNEKGIPQFNLLQNYASKTGNLVYYVFDLLSLDGHDVRDIPLIERKKLLKTLLSKNTILRYSDHVEEKGKEFFTRIQEKGLEGVIAKRKNSQYQIGTRSADWLKIKTTSRQEAIICGFTEPQGSRKYLGAVVLGVYRGDEMVYVGHSGSGLDEEGLKSLRNSLEPLIIQTSPFKDIPKTNAPVTWVKPHLVCEVKFSEWTNDGCMRHPIFVGLRTDKEAEDVKKELPMKEKPALKPLKLLSSTDTKHAKKTVLKNADKVFWPDEGITKRDLFEYYQATAPVLMNYLVNRPQTLRRHPDGIEGEDFFQKDIESAPPGITTIPIYSTTEEKDIHYLVCKHATDLLYMVNLGCIEINPWHARYDRPDKPDYCVLDLDPEDIPFDSIIEVAQVVKEVCDIAHIPSYPKTSGSRGMHVYIPLGALYTDRQSLAFATILATIVHKKIPSLTSLLRSPEKRQKKIYIDYLQNRPHQTLVAPYSVRPRPGATVSTPLEWEEVKKGLTPHDFTIHTIHSRIKEKKDLWEGVLGEGIDMEKAIASIEDHFHASTRKILDGMKL